MKSNVDLLHGNIMKSLMIFAIPMLISSIFQQMYNTVDTILVGNILGETSLAAIGVLNSTSANTLTNQTGDTSLGTAFVIDSSYPVLIRALGGLRIANVPGESVSKISFGDSPNNYISYPEQDFLVINSNHVFLNENFYNFTLNLTLYPYSMLYNDGT